MSSFGNAPSRQKSIDVEFNLLRTWSETRLDLQRRLAQRAALGLIVVVAGAAVLPLLASARAEASGEAALARRAALDASAQAREKEAAATLVRPKVDRDAEIRSSAARIESLLSGLAIVFNASPETLVVRNLQFDVAAGKLNVRIRAEAPDGETARLFARRVGAAPGIETAKASSIQEENGGVTFNFASTGQLAP